MAWMDILPVSWHRMGGCMKEQQAERTCGFRRLFCHLTGPLFRWLFLGPDGRPPFLLAKAPANLPHGHAWWVAVDERGWLLEGPRMHLHDREAWQRMETRHAILFAIMLPVSGLVLLAYFIFMHRVEIIFRHPHDSRIFPGVFLLSFLVLTSSLAMVAVAALRKGNHRQGSVSLLRRYSMKLAIFPFGGWKGAWIGFLLVPMAFTWFRHVIAAYPPTPIVLVHLWGAIVLEALFWTLAVLILLLNALFWPCLKCHGLRAEDFLYPAGE